MTYTEITNLIINNLKECKSLSDFQEKSGNKVLERELLEVINSKGFQDKVSPGHLDRLKNMGHLRNRITPNPDLNIRKNVKMKFENYFATKQYK